MLHRVEDISGGMLPIIRLMRVGSDTTEEMIKHLPEKDKIIGDINRGVHSIKDYFPSEVSKK